MLLGDANPDGTFRQQLIAALQDPEVVNILHQYSDYDIVPDGLHHQLGLRHDQSSYGDHDHDGKDSLQILYASLPTLLVPKFATFGENSGAALGTNSNSLGPSRGTFTLPNISDILIIGGVELTFSSAGAAWEVDLAINIDGNDYYLGLGGNGIISDTSTSLVGATIAQNLSAAQHTVKFHCITGAGGAGSCTYKQATIAVITGFKLGA